jgi:hypothetical protein
MQNVRSRLLGSFIGAQLDWWRRAWAIWGEIGAAGSGRQQHTLACAGGSVHLIDLLPLCCRLPCPALVPCCERIRQHTAWIRARSWLPVRVEGVHTWTLRDIA